jgi:hypothetical protein
VKRILLTGASLLALTIAAPDALAETLSFTGAFVEYTIPVAGEYEILAFGAQGGNIPGGGPTGGKGAEIRGDFKFSAGYQLRIAVGGAGANGYDSAGGGGGSFVIALANNHPLIIAGGGGGAGAGEFRPGQYGYGGRTGGDGSDGFGTSIHRGVGGSSGGGGTGGGEGGGGGGAGFAGSGSAGVGGSGGGGGGSLLDLEGGAGARKGGKGGFGAGGGGGASDNGSGSYGGGGGGGGYSGGGGGQGAYYDGRLFEYGGGGGGGGSFDGGTKPLLAPGFRVGDGEVDITEIAGAGAPVPEPSTWAMMATGFAALGLAALSLRRRKA